MRKIISLFIMFIGLSSYAQSNNSFTPTKGEITFKEITKITNRKLFDESLKVSKEKFKESLKKSLLKDKNNKGKERQIEEMTMMDSTNAMEMIYKEDSTEIYRFDFDQAGDQSFYGNVILKIFENKNNRKIINGYDCFKVTYQYRENKDNSDQGYLEFSDDTIFKREMWATEKIKSLYHPVIFEKSILEKYYPLDILETQNDIKGFERRFKLEKLTAN